jgi:hypothetical protein
MPGLYLTVLLCLRRKKVPGSQGKAMNPNMPSGIDWRGNEFVGG